MPDLATDQGGRSLFIDLPGDDRAVEATLAALGLGGPLSVPTRYAAAVYGPRPLSDRDAEVAWSTVIGALALAVLGIVIAAAFAVGARRQLRTLGILASNGASPAALRVVVLWQGAWSGLLGSAAGLALGALALVALWPHHDRSLSYEPRWFTVRPADLRHPRRLALVFTGFVIIVGLALAAAETREEVEVLTAVGASPSTLRGLAAAKAALLAGAGVALAVPTGLIPVCWACDEEPCRILNG